MPAGIAAVRVARMPGRNELSSAGVKKLLALSSMAGVALQTAHRRRLGGGGIAPAAQPIERNIHGETTCGISLSAWRTQ